MGNEKGQICDRSCQAIEAICWRLNESVGASCESRITHSVDDVGYGGASLQSGGTRVDCHFKLVTN